MRTRPTSLPEGDGSVERPSMRAATLRVRLLDRACEMIAAHGPGSLSLRRVAGDVGTSTTAIYSLFGSKAELLTAITQEAWHRFARHLRAIEETGDAFQDILELGKAYQASAEANPHYYQVMVGMDLTGEPGRPRQLPDTGGTFELLVSKVECYLTERALPGDDVVHLAAALWAAVHGVVSLEITGILHNRVGTPAVLVEQVVRAILVGWSPGEGG
jgi:AcrR family transcriptional regulator